jgi:putative DNA primase/helicase
MPSQEQTPIVNQPHLHQHVSPVKNWEMKHAFLTAMNQMGITCQDEIVSDGQIHRFSPHGRGNKDGWYVFFGFAGAFGDWRRDIHESWSFKENKLSPEERVKRKKEIMESAEKHYIERCNRYEETSELATQMWNEASETGTSAYLERKQVPAYGIRYRDDKILIPVQDSDGTIWSIQTIDPEGEKRFLVGGKKQRGIYPLKKIEDGEPIIVAEGYATAASIFKATGIATVVAFDAGNLPAVVEYLRTVYPDNPLTIAADDDRWSEHNIGREKASYAALTYRCRVVFPTFRETQTLPTDFNDLMILEGEEEVARQLVVDKPESILKSYTVKQLLELNIRPREMLLNPIIPEQGLVMIHALRGVGKTHVALMIAYSVATGGSMFADRWTCSKPHKVLVIDGEMPLTVMQERLSKIIESAPNRELKDDYLQIITPDLQKQRMRDLSTPEGQYLVEEHLKDVKLVILDNYSSLCRNGRENDSESWVPFQDWFLELRRRGISVLLVHHSNKVGGQRGTSRKEDLLDTIITLRKPGSYDLKDGARFEVHYEKARSFFGQDAMPFEAWLKQDGDKHLWQIQKIEQVQLEQIKELNKLNFTQREIADKLRISPATVNRRLKEIKEGDAGLLH